MSATTEFRNVPGTFRNRPEGAVALVTGGSRGLGVAIARELAADGWHVAVAFRSGAEGAEATAAAARELGVEACTVQADVAEPDAAKRLVDAAAELGPVLALVNNAGITADGLAMQLDDEDWDRVLETNLSSAFRLTRAALRSMVRARFGRIVNITSVAGLRANPGQSNYSAAKAGLVGLTRSVSHEVARRGVTVNAVAPGFIATDMTAGFDGVAEHVPARRVGDPADVAAAVRFLASEQAAYVTGAVLPVDGGLSA
jgi:3-oxoacyl-[acyl-carrier protein] reductase